MPSPLSRARPHLLRTFGENFGPLDEVTGVGVEQHAS
jgi:hypothetical protein